MLAQSAKVVEMSFIGLMNMLLLLASLMSLTTGLEPKLTSSVLCGRPFLLLHSIIKWSTKEDMWLEGISE